MSARLSARLPRRFEVNTVQSAPAKPAATKQTLADEVYRQMRELIVALRLSPGTPLSESDLTVRLGVSRTPIREALQRLLQEGFAAITQVGAVSRIVVAPMTIDDMQELHSILAVLEGLAARAAAELPEERRMALVTKMSDLNRELRVAWQLGPERVRDAQDLHVRFHRAVAEAAAGRRLLSQLNAIQPQVERYERVYTGALASEFRESLEEHEQVIAAIAAGDPDDAERMIINNWRRGTERSARIVKKLGERGSW
jgi:DNA-binding GntR family transcriptional regulator